MTNRVLEPVPGSFLRRICWLACAVALAGCGDSSAPKPNAADPKAADPKATDSKGLIENAIEPPVYHPPAHDGYVGSSACATCHPQIAESYQSHPMSHSIRRVDGTVVGDQPHARVNGNLSFYEVDYADAGMVHRQKMQSPDGETLFEQSVPMHYVVGSGRRAFAYLHQQNDLLFQSPLNWYSAQSKWDWSPGYVKDDPRRFRRRITDDCLACHAGRVAFKGRSLNRFESSPFHEMSIGCENCHGPGADHVAFHDDNTQTTRATDPIVNPSRLSVAARESVCNQCHLQAVARIVRPGRSDFDFRPGQTLDDIWTILDAGVDVSADGQTRAVNHVQQMRASRCYTAGNGQLGCISCHNPHGLPSGDTRISFYRDRCLACHQPDDCRAPPPDRRQHEDSCIDCHMPNRASNNISHVSQTDHRIVRNSQAVTATPGLTDVRLEFFDKANARLQKWEADRAMGLAVWLYLDKKGKPAPAALQTLLTPVLRVLPDDHAALTTLAALARQLGRDQIAFDYFEKASHLPAGEESALSGLLTLNYLASRWEPALQCADRLIELDPGEARYYSLRADILRQSGRLTEGIDSAQRALELNPTLTPVREWLVDSLKKAGRMSEHAAALELLEKMKQAATAAQLGAPAVKGQGRP